MNIIADGLEVSYVHNGEPIYFSVNYYDAVKNAYI